MKKQITHVSVMQAAKVSAVLYFFISLPLVLLMMIPVMLRGGLVGAGISLGMLIAMPVLYLVFGFIFTMIAAWLYNVTAGLVGGFEFTTTEVQT